jgi:hypothetical protein
LEADSDARVSSLQVFEMKSAWEKHKP